MKGTSVNRILSSAVKVAGSLALVGGAMAAAAAPAGAAPPPTSAYGISAFGSITIHPVAYTGVVDTPQVSGPVVYPGFITTGGILDRAKRLQAYSQVGAVKVYGFSQVEQLNASMVSSTCRLGSSAAPRSACDHPGRLDRGARHAVLPAHPADPQPGPEHGDQPGVADGHAQQADGHGQRPLTVTGIYASIPGQNLSIAVSRCRVNDLGDHASTADHRITMKGTSVNRILSSAVKVAGSLGLVGGAMAAAAAPAGAAPPPTSAYGISAFGAIHIDPVAYVNVGSTPRWPGLSCSPASSPRAGSWTGPSRCRPTPRSAR